MTMMVKQVNENRINVQRRCRRYRRLAWMTTMVMLFQCQNYSTCAESRSRWESAPDPTSSRRRKRKRRRNVSRPQVDMEHDDWSSSSFVPLVFSDDDAQEESILSALARVDQDEDDDDDVVDPVRPISSVRGERNTKHVKKQESAGRAKVEINTNAAIQEGVKAKEAVPVVEVPRQSRNIQEVSPEQPKQSIVQNSVQTTQPIYTPPARVEGTLTSPQSTKSPSARPESTFSQVGVAAFSSAQIPRKQSTATTPPLRMYNPALFPPQGGLTAPIPRSTQVVPPRTVIAPARPVSVPDLSVTTTPWVRKFLSSRPRDALLPIPRDYLADGFNLIQLAPIVERVAMESVGGGPAYSPPIIEHGAQDVYPLFKTALRLVLQGEDPTLVPPSIQRAAEIIYVLVHSRYVISPRGLETVKRVLKRPDGSVDPVFGRCTRIACRGMPLLPVGDSDDYDPRGGLTTRAKRYCPCCGEEFYMWDSKVDECAWGPSFCHLFLMTYGGDIFPELLHHRRRGGTSLITNESSRTTIPPSVFGFKLHPGSNLRYPVRSNDS